MLFPKFDVLVANCTETCDYLLGQTRFSIQSILRAMFQTNVGFFVTDTDEDKYLTIHQKLLNPAANMVQMIKYKQFCKIFMS